MRQFLLLLVLTACGAKSAGLGGARCESSDQCIDGYICREHTCLQTCVSTNDCGGIGEACENGVCVPSIPGCESDADCTPQSICETSPRCRDGACRYTLAADGTTCDDLNPCTDDDGCNLRGECVGVLRPCAEPPAASCTDNDSTFVTWSSTGSCAAGICSYVRFETPCADCAATCMARCANIVCDDTHGGCRANGVCVPSEPPVCSYDVAGDGAVCTPSPGTSGTCTGGECTECEDASDCTLVPSAYPECWVATCVSNQCVYTAQASLVCDPETCVNDVRHYERVCGADGTCPEITPDGSCGPGLLDNGATCNDGAQCLSGNCVDGVCCNTACGGNCDRCDIAASRGTCTPDSTLCTGNCDTCSASTGSCEVDAAVSCGGCGVCTGAGTVFSCQQDIAVTCGSCGACAASGIGFACAMNTAAPCGNCGQCAASGNGFACSVNTGVSCGNCGQCAASGIGFACAVNTGASCGNCGQCAASGIGFACAVNTGVSCGNCGQCSASGNGFACSQNTGVGCGACGRCSASGVGFACAVNSSYSCGGCGQCTGSGTSFTCSQSGSCGSCGYCSGSASGYDCLQSSASCGNCGYCSGGSGGYWCYPSGASCGSCGACSGDYNGYSCVRDSQASCGTCGQCPASAPFNCQANPIANCGFCGDCNPVGAAFNCQADQTECVACNQCTGVTAFSCTGYPSDPRCDAGRVCDGNNMCVSPYLQSGQTGCPATQCAPGLTCDQSSSPGPDMGRCCQLSPGDSTGECCNSSDSECGSGNHCRSSTHDCVSGRPNFSSCDVTTDCDSSGCGICSPNTCVAGTCECTGPC